MSVKTKPQKPEANDNGANAPKESFADFFKGLKTEFSKITWPTRPQIIANTIVVILVVAVVSLLMWGLDNGIRALILLLTEVLPKQLR